MATKGGSRVIAIEEHYFDVELAALFSGRDVRTPPPIRERMNDLGTLRIKDMDEAGIDLQVLSHGAPSLQKLDAESAVRMARLVNDDSFRQQLGSDAQEYTLAEFTWPAVAEKYLEVYQKA